jgi:hypothetical protein
MNARGHLNFMVYSVALFGAGLYIGEIEQEINNIVGFCIGAIVGSTFPDIDHRESQLGNIFPLWKLNDLHKKIVDKRRGKGKKKKYVNYIFRHGGITHTAIFTAWIFIAAGIVKSFALAGLGFGHMTHLYIDHVTGNKLPMLWWPIKR